MFPERSTTQRGGRLRAPLTILLLTLCLVAGGFQGCSTIGSHNQKSQDPSSRQVQASFLSVPLSFEANEGQTDPQVKFLSRGPGYGLFLTPTEAVLALRQGKPMQSEVATAETPNESAVLRMRLVGANPTPELSGETALPGKVHYFKGNDPTQWRTNVPTYGKARYKNVYPGIDLIYYGNQGQLEYDFVVAPGADPAIITMDFRVADSIELEANGDLVVHTSGGMFRHRKPLIYQEVAKGRQEVSGNYQIKSPNHIGFQIAAYDPKRPLIIDPVLVYSTYLGGINGEQITALAVDNTGSVYITGTTRSPDFPTANPFQEALGGGPTGQTPQSPVDAFVTKFTPEGKALVYSTYLGGSSDDDGSGIAVDATGSAYVTGSTRADDFPTMNPFQASLAGDVDAFITKLAPDGSALVYSTYLGGSQGPLGGLNYGHAIAVDATGSTYVTGQTGSDDFPTKNAFQPFNAGGNVETCCPGDAFVTKFTPDGSALVYSTYLGGGTGGGSGPPGYDSGNAIAVDQAGNAYVAGVTVSGTFPTVNPFQATLAGFSDGFVSKFSSDGAALLYSTYLGGSYAPPPEGKNLEEAMGIAVDGDGHAYVTGFTFSIDFPTTVNALQSAPESEVPWLGSGDSSIAFVTKLTPDGSALVYSTFLGPPVDGDSIGFLRDRANGIAVDATGSVAVTGWTASNDFPTTPDALQGNLTALQEGDGDAFVSQLTPDGSALVYSSYLGGGAGDRGVGLGVDPSGNIYVGGSTGSTDFPTIHAVQPALAGASDVFVAKIDPLRENLNDKFAPLGSGDVATAFSLTPCGGALAGTFTIMATFMNISSNTLSNLLLTVDTLTGGNVLCNANGAPGGSGATLTVPLQGDLADGQLSPGEAFVVELPVGLQSFNPFTFFVDVLGEVD